MTRGLGIRNAGFDGDYYLQDGTQELKMARNWRVAWELGPDARNGFLVRPECYPKGIGPIWAPNADICQGIQSSFATHRAAIVQVVDLPLGARDIRVEALVSYYAPGGGMAVTLGLDGTGQNSDITAETIQWSGHWLDQDGGWQEKTWSTAVAEIPVASTGRVSLWLRSQNRWRARNNHVWWRQVNGTCRVVTPDPPPPGDAPCMEHLEYLVTQMGYAVEVLEEIRDGLASVAKEGAYVPGPDDVIE